MDLDGLENRKDLIGVGREETTINIYYMGGKSIFAKINSVMKHTMLWVWAKSDHLQRPGVSLRDTERKSKYHAHTHINASTITIYFLWAAWLASFYILKTHLTSGC